MSAAPVLGVVLLAGAYGWEWVQKRRGKSIFPESSSPEQEPETVPYTELPPYGQQQENAQQGDGPEKRSSEGTTKHPPAARSGSAADNVQQDPTLTDLEEPGIASPQAQSPVDAPQADDSGRASPQGSTEAALNEKMARNERAGAPTDEAQKELKEAEERIQSQQIEIAFFGEISTGKSSLIQAILPTSRPVIAASGGSTRRIVRYRWRQSEDGVHVHLVDLPGLNEVGRTLEKVAQESAEKAHCILYVCKGDMTRESLDRIDELRALKKPLIVALNKVDRLDDESVALIHANLDKRLNALAPDAPPITIVPVSAGGKRAVSRILANGQEVEELRKVPANIDQLLNAIDEVLEQQESLQKSLKESFSLRATHALDRALKRHRRQESRRLITEYTIRAMSGALSMSRTDEAAGQGGSFTLDQEACGELVDALHVLYDVPLTSEALQILLTRSSRTAMRRQIDLLGHAGQLVIQEPDVTQWGRGALYTLCQGIVCVALGRVVIRALRQHTPDRVMDMEQVAHNFSKELRLSLPACVEGLNEVLHSQDEQPPATQPLQSQEAEATAAN